MLTSIPAARRLVRASAGALLCLLIATPAWSTTVRYAQPESVGSMPTFGTVPFPNDLYFDGGAADAGDGTLLNEDPEGPGGTEDFGFDVVVANQSQVPLGGMNRMDGFGATTPVWFFFDGKIDQTSLPGVKTPNAGRVQTDPSASDSVFLVELDSSPPRFVPAKFHWDIDSKLPYTLAVVPLEGEVLRSNTRYVAVVTKKLKRTNGKPVKRDADFPAALAAELADGLAYVTGSLDVGASKIVGMSVFTVQTTSPTLRDIRTGIVDNCPTTVDFSDGWVFEEDDVEVFFGEDEADDVNLVASGFLFSPRLQTLDPDNSSHRDGSGGDAEGDTVSNTSEVDDERFVDFGDNGNGCELTTPGEPDGLPDVIDIDPSTPAALDLARVPVSLSVPTGEAPEDGWPVIIVQHGLGGDRQTTMFFAQDAAERGFAVIGIDSVDHGLRWDETDDIFNFTGEDGQDGLPDGDLDNAVAFGFFERFGNLLAVRDNFRQTYTDLMQLVHILSEDGFDEPLDVDLDPDNIYYLGLSLGGLMGSGMAPYVPEVRAIALDAPGGGFQSELLTNSSIGASFFPLLQLIFGLDRDTAQGDFAFNNGVGQSILDPGDATISAVHWADGAFDAPFRPMNVILFEDMQDAVVPNQASEALAVAAGLPLFDPHVENLPATERPLDVVATEGFIDGNLSGATAAVFQVGPGVHAVLDRSIADISYVPNHALWNELRDGAVDSVFVPLLRDIRVQTPGILDDIYDWFEDSVENPGSPGRFEYTDLPLSYNSLESQQIGRGDPKVYTFLARTVNADGQTPTDELTPDVSIEIRDNSDKGRMTVSRSTLGSTEDGANDDMPPGIEVETADVLPFFVSIQRPGAPTYEGRKLTVSYTDDELAASDCDEAALFLARFDPRSDTYDALPSTVDAAANQVQTEGKTRQSGDGIYGVFCSTDAAEFNSRLGLESLEVTTPSDPEKNRTIDVAAAFPTEELVDPTQSDIEVEVWEDLATEIFSGTLPSGCWREDKPDKRWSWKAKRCDGVDPGDFRKAELVRKSSGFEITLRIAGELPDTEESLGGGGSQVALAVGEELRSSAGGRCRQSGDTLRCSKYDAP